MSNVQVGEIIDGRYRVEAVIAKGGMSTVFRCEDVRLGRRVAVKVMDDRYLDDAIFRSRFVREAKSMAQLGHPNIVDVYDFNSTGDHAYLVMELISGGTLRELLAERGPMPPHAATQVMRGLLTGLSVAHKQGLVHRDIKPDNVLINKDHRVKLTDFGLVRAVAQSEHTSDKIIGTVSYLSPEQVDGGHIGPESDVYSAGVLLFELLTGTTPFDGDTQIAHAMQRLSHDVPAPSSRIDGVPQLFDELVAAATHRDPAERFPTAAEFLAALEDVATELELPSFKVPVPTNTAVARATEVVAGATEVVAPLPPLAPPVENQSTSILPPLEPTPAPAPIAEPPTEAFPVAPQVTPPNMPPITPEPETRDVPAVREDQSVAFEAPTPVSNRSTAKLIAWFLVVALLIASVAVGGWWFGSGRYGEIPQILGEDRPTAIQLVSDAGFDPVVTEVFSDDVTVGKAVGTAPPFGSRVPRSDQVEVLISKGLPTVPVLPASGDIAEYRRAVEERTLILEIGGDVFSNDVPKGQIVSVSPSPGVTVKTESVVTASISKGAAPVDVPDVAGMSQEDATRTLTDAGLTVGSVQQEFSQRHKPGHVISTSPGSHAKLARGSEVNLKVSNALEMPSVIGKTSTEAVAQLESLGFVVTLEDTSDAGTVPYEIVGTSARAGALIDPASPEVTLQVANRVRVPSVVGRTMEDATQILTNMGLSVNTRRDGSRVLTQSPRAGAKVDIGSTVELTALR
ncbi:Stk1 family PASTA domain-containing Ser/Thr kinase [Corynebacterium hindlerae]|uniref:Stk1 family PASTA domain-containing Ser/Thr kinase n=1 Tax=Corynebacterium hindlerae TaxID=699041 RepID=UPI001AD7D04D|nr:Stk1 family PASTA domain-containing Ser/Thr kinase [Corynebacterium hindlerae]QTH59100.1 Stk1 family PASTA domain-containing Ser/Thr kinase [Corynebacterium hindlerae]